MKTKGFYVLLNKEADRTLSNSTPSKVSHICTNSQF